jgi:phosphoglycerate dehydrogenase-like enzyme
MMNDPRKANIGKLGNPAKQAQWERDNLILSFHRTVSREQMERIIEMFCENLRRYHRGQPMLGLVDKKAGY